MTNNNESKNDSFGLSEAPDWIHQANLASHQAAREFSAIAIKGMTLTNGGAAIALLAFLPDALAIKGVSVWQFAISLPVFGLGAIAGAMCAGLAAISQSHFTRAVQEQIAKDTSAYKASRKKGMRWQKFSRAIGGSSLLAFLIALLFAAWGFSGAEPIR